MLKSRLFLWVAALGVAAQTQVMVPQNTMAAGATGPSSALRQMSPSSRRSPLIISEIMYHAQNRVDGKNLEFVELCNTEPVDWDISGFALAGDIEYIFPKGTILPARSFVVVAADPGAMQLQYSITGVLGPFTGRLANGGGALQLINRRGGVLVDLDYDDHAPWPESSDGLGHSLVLTRPDYGEANARAWQASAWRGGNPNQINAVTASAWEGVCINEVLAHSASDQEDFIELYNHSAFAVDLSGGTLSDDPGELKFRLPDDTVIPAGGTLAFSKADWGNAMDLDPLGDRVYLLSADQETVIDAVTYGAQDVGVSEGRWPNGAYGLRAMATATPSQANAAPLPAEIVINEIMYHAISEDANDEYVELYNPGTQAVDLGGWTLTSGIDYTMPNHTVIAGGGYLVIAAHAEHLISRYPQLTAENTVGDFSRTLSHRGERIRLRRPLSDSPAEKTQVIVDEVSYGDDESWGKWADAGGSSLELIDPASDNSRAGNWAASDETNKAPWTTFSWTGVLDHGSGRCDAYEVMLLDNGECMIDDIVITRSGSSENRAQNGDFEFGPNGWDIEGNHVQSMVVSGAGTNESQGLHLIATGDGDNQPNCLRHSLSPRLQSGETATLTGKGRWLCGNRNVLLRLHGNYLELTGTLDIPEALGTPGLLNSRFLVNAGPVIEETTHAPILPQAHEDMVITARVSDIDGVNRVTLNYRIDPSLSYTSQAMNDNGFNGDELAGDGMYSVRITGRAAGTLIAFYVEAEDDGIEPAMSRFPAADSSHEALIRIGESVVPGVFGNYRMWVTAECGAIWSDAPRLSNEMIEGTFVYGDFRVVYNAGIRMRGSGWIRTRFDDPFRSVPSFVVKVKKSDRVMGSTSFNLDNLQQDDVWGRGVLDPTFLYERMSYWIGEQIGVETCYQRFVLMHLNGDRKGVVFTDTQQPNRDYLRCWFPDDNEGHSFELDSWFEYDNGRPRYVGNATLKSFTTTDGAEKQARYRWNWEKKVAHATDDDYTPLFELVDVMNSTTDYVQKVDALVDWNQWMRGFAVRRGAAADRDGYGYEAGKNAYVYKGLHSKWKYILWDLDLGFGIERSYDAGLFDEISDPVLKNNFFQEPMFLRAYWRALQDLVDGPMASETFDPAVDAYYQAFQANGIVTRSPGSAKTWVRRRGGFIREQLQTVEAPFRIDLFGGQTLALPVASLPFAGTAPVKVDKILLNGVEQQVTWKSVTDWSLTVEFSLGENILVFSGLDSYGDVIPGMSDTVTITSTGTH